jgi:hypothetical protein
MKSRRRLRSIARHVSSRLENVLVSSDDCATSVHGCRAQQAKQSTKGVTLGMLVKQSTPLCRKVSCGPSSPEAKHCMCCQILHSGLSTKTWRTHPLDIAACAEARGAQNGVTYEFVRPSSKRPIQTTTSRPASVRLSDDRKSTLQYRTECDALE